MFPAACVVMLAVVVILALTVGRWPAVVVALVGALGLNWGFTRPEHSFRMNDPGEIVVLVVFLVMALVVSMLLNRAVARAVSELTSHSGQADELDLGDWLIDFRRKRVLKEGTEVLLTPTEWSFLELLARNVGQLVPRDEILSTVWGAGYQQETNYLRVYIGQLRRKLEDDPANPHHLITTHGVGYTLQV